jgi:hypothetical protein
MLIRESKTHNGHDDTLGMFPQTGEWAGGEAAFPAALKALDQINQREDILPGYYLNLSAYDTQVKDQLISMEDIFFSFSVHQVLVRLFSTNYSIIKRLAMSTVRF